MSITIFTRSHNDLLYNRAAEFWPDEIDRHKCTDFNYPFGAVDFLHHVIQYCPDIAVICDEDCYIYNWPLLESLIEGMEKPVLAVPDGGITPHRGTYDWFQLNPFFMVIDCGRIRASIQVQNLTSRFRYPDSVNKWGYTSGIEKYRPDWISAAFGWYAMDSSEPFYGLSCWLVGQGLVKFLKPANHPDGISTDIGFALHSWYARDYDNQAERIDSIYHEAKGLVRG